MELIKAIEIYMGRSVDFPREVEIADNGYGASIKTWNLSSEKRKPSMNELEVVYVNGIKKYELEKTIKQNEGIQELKAVNFIKFNFDKIKRSIILSEITESKIENSFDNIFIDVLADDSNIDWDNCSNVSFDSQKGILQLLDLSLDGIIQTKPINSSTGRIMINGQGMIPEYNYGALISASNDGGSTFEELSFQSQSSTTSNVHDFSSLPTGQVILKIVLVPKAIDPEKDVSGKAYLTSFAIIY